MALVTAVWHLWEEACPQEMLMARALWVSLTEGDRVTSSHTITPSVGP